MCPAPILGVSANILWELKLKVDDTIKEPEFIFEFQYLPTSFNPQAEVINSLQSRGNKRIQGFGMRLAIEG